MDNNNNINDDTNVVYQDNVTTPPKSKFLIIILLVLFVGVGVLIALYFYFYLQPKELPTQPEVVSEQDEGIPVYEEGSPVGELFYSASLASDSYHIPYIFKHDFASAGHNNRVTEKYAFTYDTQKDTTAMIMFIDNDDDPDRVQPSIFDPTTDTVTPLPNLHAYNEDDLTLSPDGIHYAYAYQTKERLDSLPIKNWNIAVYNVETKQYEVIEEATEPHWVDEGTTLLYMKESGIYLYDVSTKESSTLTEEFTGFSNVDDIAVSADGSLFVLTMPISRQVYVADLGTTDESLGLTLRFKIEDKTAHYHFPVISPDNKFIAMMVAADDAFNSDTQMYRDIPVEIWSVQNIKLVKSIVLGEVAPDSVRLERWLKNN